jgi:urea carboxylase system permease
MDSKDPAPATLDRDAADLAKFGYKQELRRTLGVFSSFAVAFSYISPSTGIFTLYFLALGSLGGVMFWTWPIVIGGQLLIALNWAELSSHYPVAGSVYQWTKYLSGRTYAWFTGWIYLFAGVITVAAVVATLPIALIPVINNVFNVHLNNTLGSGDQKVIALMALVVITILNIYGVKVVALINNAGVVFEILGMVIFAVFLAALHNHQGIGVIFKTGGVKLTPSTFLVGMFMSLFVVYGFDTASTLAEETKDPRREAPKAVLASIIGAFIIGAIFLLGTLMAIPDLKEAVAGLFGPQTIIEANLNSALATSYLVVVAAAIFICCLAIMTSTIRLCFGMARDDQLPASKSLARVNPRWHTPMWSCIAIGLLSAIPFLQFGGATIIAVSATAMIYLSYLLGNVAVMRARLKGWPRVSAPFKLGMWGKVVNVLGIAWGAGMLVNFFWPASTGSLRVFANPRPNQTDFLGTGKPLVDLFGIDWLNKTPIIWTVTAFIVLVGLVYYVAFQRKKPFTPVVPPEEEVEAVRI